MKLHLTLVAALTLSTISPVVAAPAKTSAKTETKKTLTKSGSSLKAKVITALGIAASAVVAILVLKYKINERKKNKQIDDELINFSQKNDQERSNGMTVHNPGGQAGMLLQYLMHNNNHFAFLVRNNPRANRNVEELFNDERFIAHLNGPLGEWCRGLLIREFERDVAMTYAPGFADAIIAGFNHEAAKLVQPQSLKNII